MDIKNLSETIGVFVKAMDISKVLKSNHIYNEETAVHSIARQHNHNKNSLFYNMFYNVSSEEKTHDERDSFDVKSTGATLTISNC